jgi:hypothetical protein
VIQSDEIKCSSNKLGFMTGEGWKAGASSLLHALRIVSEQEWVQDAAIKREM